MTIEETRARIQARVWQALAQNDVPVKQLSREDLENLVSLVTDAALVEVDKDLGKARALSGSQDREAAGLHGEEERGEKMEAGERVLWQGRPFLSFNTEYIITNQRVRIIEGIMGKDRNDIELVRIQDVNQTQTVRERLLNLGDITILSHDRSHPVIVLNNVQDPQQVHEILRVAVLEARDRNRFSYREEM